MKPMVEFLHNFAQFHAVMKKSNAATHSSLEEPQNLCIEQKKPSPFDMALHVLSSRKKAKLINSDTGCGKMGCLWERH